MKTPTSKKKVVIFDWGGVIESHRDDEYNFNIAIVKTFKRLGCSLSDEEVLNIYKYCYKDDNGIYMSEVNKVEDVVNWFERMKLTGNFGLDFNDFVDVYEDETSKIYYYKDVVEFAHSLKSRCPIAILSNLNYLDKKRIDMQVNLDMFDNVFLSFELNCRKPDFKIYEIVEKTYNLDSFEILFIDDKKENIDAARNRGWKVCQASGIELDKIRNEVNKFLND